MNYEFVLDDDEFIQSQRELWNQFSKSSQQPSSSIGSSSSFLCQDSASHDHSNTMMIHSKTMDHDYDITEMLQDKTMIDEQRRILQLMKPESSSHKTAMALKSANTLNDQQRTKSPPSSPAASCTTTTTVMTSPVLSIETILNHDEVQVIPQAFPTSPPRRTTTLLPRRIRHSEHSRNAMPLTADPVTPQQQVITNTTRHDPISSYHRHADDRVIRMGNCKLTVKGTSHVYSSILQGSATLVQCSSCHAILQVGSTTKIVYCVNCQELTPMEVARNVSTTSLLRQGGRRVGDRDIAEVVQWQEDEVARARKGSSSLSLV